MSNVELEPVDAPDERGARTRRIAQVAAMLLLAAIIGWRMTRPNPERDAYRVCRGNLEKIGKALEQYREDWGNYPLILTQAELPEGIPGDGLYPRYIKDPAVFKCPKFPKPQSPPGYLPSAYGYELHIDPRMLYPAKYADPEAKRRSTSYFKELYDRFGKDTTLVWCHGHYPPAAPDADKALALKVDGRVVWVPMEDEQEKFKRGYGQKSASTR